jgi:hypothetical protein
MAAKKKTPAFNVPSSGQSDAGWVYKSGTAAPAQGEAPVPVDGLTPQAAAATAAAETVHNRSTGTYARLPEASSAQGVEKRDMEQMNNDTAPGTLLVNGVKVLGEVAVVPGASLIVDGQVKSGIFHAAGGLLGLAVLGPVLGPLTWLAVGADSYSRSVSGKTIVDQFTKKKLAL